MLKKLFTLTFLITAFGLSAQQSMLTRYIQATGGQLNDTLDNGTVVTLDLSTDDAEQENDEVDGPYDDDLDCGWEGAPDDLNILNLGLRFRDLWIPNGATIDSAFIVLHAHEGKSAADVAMITIKGEAADNAATFDSTNFNDNYLLTDRPTVSTEVSWTVAEDWTIWQPYSTPDVGGIIEEIVARPGWTSGNAIAFILEGEDQGPSTVENAREFTSFENIADPDDVDPQGNPGDGTNHPERRPYLMIYVNGPLGQQEIKIAPSLSIFPNPSENGIIHLELSSDDLAKVEVVNLAGSVVAQYEVAEELNTFNLSDLNPGIYLMKVAQNGEVSTQKFVIK